MGVHGKGFNPRTHESATKGQNWRQFVYIEKVSIHALMRVRPHCFHAVGKRSPGFNPRTHESATQERKLGYHVLAGFNPRTHESATGECHIPYQAQSVSIHALMRVRPPGRLWH